VPKDVQSDQISVYMFIKFVPLTCFAAFIKTLKGIADGGTVVKVLGYKSEGRWFDSRWCHWNFSLT
jgi:hypothetical protein